MARLPSEQAISGLVDAHFSAENWSFPVLDENRFRNMQRQFQKHVKNKTSSDNAIHLPADLTIFPALLFSVLSVKLQFTTPDSEQARALDLCTLTDATGPHNGTSTPERRSSSSPNGRSQQQFLSSSISWRWPDSRAVEPWTR